MTIRESELPQFRAFRHHLEEWALGQLEATNRPYVATFARRITQTPHDLAQVIAETAPLLGPPTTWPHLLTALLDVELYFDRCRRAVWFLGFTPAAPQAAPTHPGAWLLYHIDTWHVVACALLERIRTLISLTCRTVIRPKSPRFKIIEAQLVAEVQNLKKFIEDQRDRIAHGGGSVEALERDKLWEPYLVVRRVFGSTDTIDIIGNYYDGAIRYQTSWHSRAQRFTTWIFAFSEVWLRRLTEEAFADGND